MRVPGLKLARRSIRRARSRAFGGILVLGYHRVGGGEDPFGLAVSVRRFSEQISVIAASARPMSLASAVDALTTGTPRRSVVVTFDDGYRDTFEEVLPLLERARVPATVFVSTGFPGKEFWWDELTRIVMASSSLPRRLEIPLGHRMRSWSVHSAESRNGSVAAAGRRRVLAEVARELRVLKPVERDAAMRVLRGCADSCSQNGLSPRALTAVEIRELAASPCIDIGAHTVTHPVLTALGREEQRAEIQRSRQDLQELTGRR